SSVYKHFRKPEIIKNKNGEVVHRFVCKKHPSKHVDRLENQDSTGNLARHVKACDPDEVEETEMIEAYAHGTKYSPARIRFYTTLWCARRHRPFQIVDDPELRAILKSLYNKVELPSRHSVSRDVQDIHTLSKAHVIELFKARISPLTGPRSLIFHVCIDGWTAPNVVSFLGVTAHWHDAGEIKHIILDFLKFVCHSFLLQIIMLTLFNS
ncbi:hypothetical protein LXA43DRAFT_904527, partial [Ganoderma leucocontextum]